MFLLDYERGRDSTGLAAVRNGGAVHMSKIASHPIDLFDQGSFKVALTGATSRAFIGHNRAATRGGVNGVNAHPFMFGNIVGAHNGTLDFQSTKRLEEAAEETFNVDSMAIFACFDKIGVDATIALMEEGRDSHTGAWSLVWYNTAENSLNFLRNKHRPLWYGWSKDFSRFYWGSEWRYIEAAVGIGGGDFYLDKEFHRFWQTKEDTHYKFDLAAFKTGDKPSKPVVKERKGREPVQAASGGTWSHGNFTPTPRRDWPSQSGGAAASTSAPTTTTSTTTSRSLSSIPDKPKILQLLGDDTNPLAGVYPQDRFAEVAKYGCSWCQKPVFYSDGGITIYDRDRQILCAEHSGHSAGNDKAPVRIYLPGGQFDVML